MPIPKFVTLSERTCILVSLSFEQSRKQHYNITTWRETSAINITNYTTWPFEGFGMLESGIVSLKNEVNIMMKNVVDVVLGGVTYWAFGYGLSYGSGEALIIHTPTVSYELVSFLDWGTNPMFGVGSWFVNGVGIEAGPTFTTFLFQASFKNENGKRTKGLGTWDHRISECFGNFSSPLRRQRRRSCPEGSLSGATSTRTASSPSSTPSCIACLPAGSGPTTDFSSEKHMSQ